MSSKPNKIPKRAVNGVLLLNKARGLSSNTALQKIRRLYRAEKAGHTGVLDPLAQGLLPICFGEATKYAQYLLDADKAYIAELQLGAATDTLDAEGDVIATSEHMPNPSEFQNACEAFVGDIEQIPPMYSALKFQGKALYDYARKGITIERKARQIHIKYIHILDFTPPIARIDVGCSKGTYIRVLAEDIAKKAGTLAHLTGLIRTQTAGFTLDQAHSEESLALLSESERDKLLLPCDILLQHFDAITLNDDDILCLKRGQVVQYLGKHEIIRPLRLYSSEGEFIGLVTEGPTKGTLKALRLMATH